MEKLSLLIESEATCILNWNSQSVKLILWYSNVWSGVYLAIMIVIISLYFPKVLLLLIITLWKCKFSGHSFVPGSHENSDSKIGLKVGVGNFHDTSVLCCGMSRGFFTLRSNYFVKKKQGLWVKIQLDKCLDLTFH